MDPVSLGSLGSLSSTDLLQVQGTDGYAERSTAIGRHITMLKAALGISGIPQYKEWHFSHLFVLFYFIYSRYLSYF